MIDHIGISVQDYEVAKAFYAKTLAPLGYQLMMEVGAEITESGQYAAGFGIDAPIFWIEAAAVVPPTHVAFQAKSRALVTAFYEAALQAGGKDNGAPGLRTIYHPNYYGAFVIDPSGHNIEAVCHDPQG